MGGLKLLRFQAANFRNLQNETVELSQKVTCILGENGNGKTNFLEAVSVLISRKSFRKNTSFPQILSVDSGKNEIILSAVFSTETEQLISYSGKLENTNGRWFLDGRPTQKRIPVETVFISPFDSYNFYNSPSFRRRWFDQHIGMLNRNYKRTLNKYNDAIKFRNKLLSTKPQKWREQIFAIDQQISTQCREIIEGRLKFLEMIGPKMAETFKQIFSEEHKLNLTLQTPLKNASEQKIFAFFQENLSFDEQRGHTTVGPQKDDYVLQFDGLDGQNYSSLGQQKMSYLSLLFAYIELFRYIFRAYPIVLMDDVSGELDKTRWSRLVGYLADSEFQVLITTANEEFRRELEKIEGVRRIQISHGAISVF